MAPLSTNKADGTCRLNSGIWADTNDVPFAMAQVANDCTFVIDGVSAGATLASPVPMTTTAQASISVERRWCSGSRQRAGFNPLLALIASRLNNLLQEH